MNRDARTRTSDLAVLALFGVGFACGVIGFWREYAATPNSVQRALDAVHSTLQLVILNVDAAATQGPLLSTARLLLPLSVSLLVLSMLVARATQWRTRAWLGVRHLVPFVRPLVLVLGCGASGLKLARYYASGGMRVVGVDRDIGSPGACRFRAQGLRVLEIELMPGGGLGAVPLRAAKRVVVCTGDDATDLEVCRNLLRSMPAGASSPKLTVTFDTPGVNRIIQFDPLLEDRDAANVLNVLDLAQFSARLLFRDRAPHALREPGRRFVAGAENACHIALAMNPACVESYLVQAVRALVYSVRHPLRVSVLVEDAAACERRLRSRYPALFRPGGDDDAAYGAQTPLALVQVFESSPTQINVRALRAAHAAHPIDAIYVLGADDAETALLLTETIKGADVLGDPKPAVVAAFAAETALQGGARVPVSRTVPTDSGNDRLAAKAYVFDETAPTGLRVECFGLDAWLKRPPASASITPDALEDELARAIHRGYGADGRGEGWENLPEHERWFNRHSADHALIKLALLRATPQGGAGDLDAALGQHAAWLARLEHRRYVCERMLDGWIRRLASRSGDPAAEAEGRPKLNRYHLNPTLQPFDTLPENERNKDWDIAHLLEVARSSQPASAAASGPPVPAGTAREAAR